MRCVARLFAVAITVLFLSAAPSAVGLARADEGHGAATPAPSAATHDQHTGTTEHHSTGTTEPSGGHGEHGTTVAGTGPDADTRLLVLSLFAGVNGLVLMVASVQRSRTAEARARRRAARAAAPPAV